MKRHQRARRHDQAAVGCMREGSDRALDLARVAHVDCAQLYPERRRNRLDGAELARPSGDGGIPKNRCPRHARRDLFEQFHPFRAHAVSNKMKPVALPPGRVRLSTKPAPTGSTACANTMGMVRVAICNAATVGLAVARMTSGASVTNSAAYLR